MVGLVALISTWRTPTARVSTVTAGHNPRSTKTLSTRRVRSPGPHAVRRRPRSHDRRNARDARSGRQDDDLGAPARAPVALDPIRARRARHHDLRVGLPQGDPGMAPAAL